MRIHSLEAAEKIALRIKDYSALEKAIDDKLEEQALFAADYKNRFQAGNPHISKKPSTGLIKAKEYCQGFGFSWTTVKRWCEKLLGPEKAAGKVSARIEIGSRLPNLSWGHHQAVAWLDPKAIEAYAKQANNKTLQADALEITLRAERRLGQLLAESPKAIGGQPYQSTSTKKEPVEIPTLADMGIDKKLSAHKTKTPP